MPTSTPNYFDLPKAEQDKIHEGLCTLIEDLEADSLAYDVLDWILTGLEVGVSLIIIIKDASRNIEERTQILESALPAPEQWENKELSRASALRYFKIATHSLIEQE